MYNSPNYCESLPHLSEKELDFMKRRERDREREIMLKSQKVTASAAVFHVTVLYFSIDNQT